MTESYVDTPEPGEFDAPVPVEKPEPLTKEFQGFTIQFPTLDKHRFHVPNLDGTQWFDSYDNAVEAIKQQIAADQKASIAGLKIEHEAMTELGQVVTVTGINRALGEVMVTGLPNDRWGKPQRTYDGPLYPNLPWVKEALTRLEELHAVESKLQAVAVRGSRGGYSRRISATAYPNKLAKLEEELTQAKAKAEQEGAE